MTTQQTAGEAKPGRLGETDNALCRHFFPAPWGRAAADAQHHTA